MEWNERSLPDAISNLLRNNNYTVNTSVHIHGAEVDIIAESAADPYSSKIYIEATCQRVDNTKYGKDATKFILIREIDPQAICIIISPQGFTADVTERAAKSRIILETYDSFFSRFEKFDPYTDMILSDQGRINQIEGYEKAFFDDSHGRDCAIDWLSDWKELRHPESKWLIVLGEYGTGKTCLSEIAQFLWLRDYKKDPSRRIPLRIALADFARQFDARSLLHHALDLNKLGHVPIDFVFSLIRQERMVLILDGYDEMAQFMNPKERRACLAALAELAQGGARGIITSRPNYFTEDEELRVYESLYTELSHKQALFGKMEMRIIDEERKIDSMIESQIINRFERNLRDLSPEQTLQLVERKLPDDTRGQELIKTIMSRTFHSPNSDDGITQLSGKPVIVTYLLEIIEEIKDDDSALGPAEEALTEWSIFDIIINKLMIRDFRRVAGSMSPVKRRQFLEHLAMNLSERDSRVAQEDTFSSLISKVFDTELRMLDGEDRLRKVNELFEDLRSSTTLTRNRSVSGWIFSHNSLREFLVASRYVNGVINGDLPESRPEISLLMRHFITSIPPKLLVKALEKFKDIWRNRNSSYPNGKLLSVFWDALTQISRAEGKPLESYLSDQLGTLVCDEVSIKNIEFSKDCFQRNAIEFHAWRSEFEECQWIGLDLRGSNFDSSALSSIKFSKCSLHRTCFCNSLIIGCIIEECDLAEADFRGMDQDSEISFVKSSGIEALSGEELRGYLAFRQAFVDEFNPYFKIKHHPNFDIVEKILSRLKSQRNNQYEGLTQRGASARNPNVATQFIRLLSSEGIISFYRGNLVQLTPNGRNVIGAFFETKSVPDFLQAFLS